MQKSFFLLILSGIAFLSAPVFSQDFSHVVIFGDSLSDNGNIPRRYNVDFPEAPYWRGRFSNGPTYAEDFPLMLGIPQDKTLNYAVGGARTNHENSVYQSWQSGQTPTPPQHYQNLKGTGVMSQIDNYIKNLSMPSGHSVLFTVFAGPNNYLNLGRVQPISLIGFLKEANKLTSEAADDLYKNAQNLIQHKQAAWILMPNMPNLGNTPGARQKGERVMDAGFVITKLHNQKLAERVENLVKDHDVNIYIVDFYSLFKDIIDNPQKYNITNTRDACTENKACVNTASIQDQYLFFDPIHPTRVIHKVAAGFLVDTLQAPRQAIAQVQYATNTALLFDRRLSSLITTSSTLTEDGLQVLGDLSRKQGTYNNLSVAVNARYNTTLLTMGVAKNFGRHFTAIASLALSDGQGKSLHNRGKFNAKTVHIGAGAEWRVKFLALKAGASLISGKYDLKRPLLMEKKTVHAKPEGLGFAASAEARLLFKWKALRFEPLARFRTAHIKMESYEESGASNGAAAVSSIKNQPQNLELGGQIGGLFEHLTWRAEGVWIIGLNNKLRIVETSSVSNPALHHTFMTNIADLAYGRLEGALGYQFSPGFSFEVGGDRVFSIFNLSTV